MDLFIITGWVAVTVYAITAIVLITGYLMMWRDRCKARKEGGKHG